MSTIISVIPAKAGISISFHHISKGSGIPAFAGMTVRGSSGRFISLGPLAW